MPKVKLPFYPPCKVKYGLQNGVSTLKWLVRAMKQILILEPIEVSLQIYLLKGHTAQTPLCINNISI